MRVDGAHPLSVMVVAVSPRVRMVLRVGRCVGFMGVWLSGHFGQCITLLYRVWVVAWLILLRGKGSMMGRLSRRLMFTGGLGVVAGSVLSACAVSRPAPSRTEGFSSSPSPMEEPFWDDKDRSGEVKYWEFQAVGKFIPGTREHRAWGVPIPRPYQSSNGYAISHMRTSIGMWVSALNYLLLTGEVEPLKVIDPELKTARPDIVKLYEDEAGWVISPDKFPIKAELLAPQPAETSEGSKVFTWSARLNVDADALVFYADTKESRPLAEVLRLQSGEIQLQVAYVEGKWRSETAYDVVYQVS